MMAFLVYLVPISLLVFVIGLLRPKWILFWMKEPDRIWASSVGLLLFMAGVTVYSELKLKPKAPGQQEHHQERSAEDRNQLNMDAR
ncbi:hypothetical protein [Methylomagnum sp.]